MNAGDAGAIRPEERFDEDRLAGYLRGVVPGLDGAVEFHQFHGGHANLTYLVSSGDAEYVVRRPPLGEVAPGSHDMSREYRVLSVLYRSYPLAPRAFHYCDDDSVMGKPFVVMERRTGTVIRGAWPETLPDSDGTRRSVAEGVVDAIASLHLVDPQDAGLEDLGRPEGFVTRQLDGWTDRWSRARHDDVPDMEALARALRDAPPEPQRASVLHNDFKLDNTMVDDAGRLIAVFDWDMATLGDPLVDLGTTMAYFSAPPELAAVVPSDGVVLNGQMGVDDVVDRYASMTGLDCSRLGWHRALGYFRIAVILQQIHVRFLRGQTTDQRFAVLGSMIPPLAAAGLTQVREGTP